MIGLSREEKQKAIEGEFGMNIGGYKKATRDELNRSKETMK